MDCRKKVLAVLYSFFFGVFCPSWARGSYITEPVRLADLGAKFTWEEAKAKSLKILVQRQDANGKWKRAGLGSGFLISPDGYFITAYHVMKYCVKDRKNQAHFSMPVACSAANRKLQYKAENGGSEFDIQLISFLSRKEATSGGEFQTPDQIIKHRDFVIGKIQAPSGTRFPFWKLTDFREGTVDTGRSGADFHLKPMWPPKKVFVAGYPGGRDFAISDGFLNLADDHHRGYFAADFEIYARDYLEKQGVPPDTQWGLAVENHMSGGAVLDVSGFPIGLIVNGDATTAGILSIENVLETFFSRQAKPGSQPAVLLNPTKTGLYLR